MATINDSGLKVAPNFPSRFQKVTAAKFVTMDFGEQADAIHDQISDLLSWNAAGNTLNQQEKDFIHRWGTATNTPVDFGALDYAGTFFRALPQAVSDSTQNLIAETKSAINSPPVLVWIIAAVIGFIAVIFVARTVNK